MSLYIKGSYWNDLQSAVQLTQQWATVNGKSKDLVVAQSHEAGCFSWSSRRQMCWQVSKSSMEEAFLLPLSYVGFQQKLRPRLQACTTTPAPKLFFTWNLLCPRLALNSEICLSLSPGIKGVYHLAWASWPLCLKIWITGTSSISGL